MASIDRTAYPRFRGLLTDAGLEAEFNLSEDDEAFVRRHARGKVGRLSMALSLKTRQFLGYFPALDEVPDQIRRHIANELGFDDETVLVDGVARPATVHRYREAIRKHLGSRPFSHGGRDVVIRTVHRAAQVMSDPADLISARSRKTSSQSLARSCDTPMPRTRTRNSAAMCARCSSSRVVSRPSAPGTTR
jgi:hypothetical protein